MTNRDKPVVPKIKDLEDINVANKDRAAILWCGNVTRLAGRAREYLKVRQTDFERLQPSTFPDLAVLQPQPDSN